MPFSRGFPGKREFQHFVEETQKSPVGLADLLSVGIPDEGWC